MVDLNGMFDESDMLLAKTSMPAIADWLLKCLLSHLTRSTYNLIYMYIVFCDHSSNFSYTLPYVPIFRKQSSVSIVKRCQRMVAKFASISTSR